VAETTTQAPISLYLEDETAWLDLTSRLVAEGRFHEVDAASLSEYLSDMAIRDRREVMSRLVVLLTHLLKWDHQPAKRTANWESTILTQRNDLQDIFQSRTLRNHALDILDSAYVRAVRLAAIQTRLPEQSFPTTCPYSLSDLLADR
jgi:Domain of unknown function DUF29